MQRTDRRRITTLLRVMLLGALLAGLPAVARARTETLRWTHSGSEGVSGFKIYVGATARTYENLVDVGLPARDAAGVYSRSIDVVDGATVYLAVSAYNSTGEESPYSNEQVRGGIALGAPGKPGLRAP